MCPDRLGLDEDDNDDNINRKENYGKKIPTNLIINSLTKRSTEIRSKIEDMTNDNSSLFKLNEEQQLRSIVTNEKLNHAEGKERYPHNLTIKNEHLIPKPEIIEIIESLGDLNHELVNVNEDLIASLENLNKKYDIQQEFISIAVHEIRSPCHAIIGYVELLNLEPVNSKKYLKLIARNAERLDLLISNILDASRIDNKTLTLKKEKFDLVELIEQIIEDINNKIKTEKNKKIDVLFENVQLECSREINDDKEKELGKEVGMVIVEADKGKIIQVIFNLLENAIRYTTEGKIIVSIKKSVQNINSETKPQYKDDTNESTPEQQHQEKIIVQIKDAGNGIDSKILPMLFSKFTSDLTTGGTGLGLFISKNIIEAHGGKIWAKNKCKGEKGAIFSFSLPIRMD